MRNQETDQAKGPFLLLEGYTIHTKKISWALNKLKEIFQTIFLYMQLQTYCAIWV